MKKILTLLPLLVVGILLSAQNVGIGVVNPTKKISVNGSIVVDHGGDNLGELDSAALLFGASPYQAGITSNQFPPGIGYKGLDLWTNGSKRISIAQNGNVGISVGTPQYKLHVNGDIAGNANSYVAGNLRLGPGPYNGNFRLHVNNGNSYFAGDGTFTGDLMAQGNFIAYQEVSSANIRATSAMRADVKFAVGGATDDNYRLRVYDGNARIGGEFHATGNSAIGGLPDAAFRFRVYDGNSRMGGNLQVTGNLDAGSLTVDGKGSVASNGPSSLSMGFSALNVDMGMGVNAVAGVWLNLPAFSDADDMRVMLSNVDADPLSIQWARVNITIGALEASDDRVFVQFHNQTGAAGTLKGTLYFTTVQRH